MTVYDVCVIGAGIEGSSTARYLATQGKETLLLEQFHLPHSRGSSHGSTRLVRYGYSDSKFSKLMPEAFEMWSDIEKKAGKELIKRVGLLSAESPPFKNISKILINVRSLGVNCQALSNQEIKTRFPALKLPPNWSGALEPDGGFVLANQALKVIQQQFIEYGGTLCDGEKVQNIEPGTIVKVHTAKTVFQAKAVVIAAGPWVNEVVKPLGLKFPVEIWRVLLTYWKPQDPQKFSEKKFPGFILYCDDIPGEAVGHEHIYGFPVFEYPGLIKICHHGGVPITSPESRETGNNDLLLKRLSQAVKKNFHGIEPVPKIIEPCIYTCTPDDCFILDHHPVHHNIVVGAGFSGHGFKMAPVVGKILSQLALGEKPSYNMEPFKMSRFANFKSSL